MNVVITGTGKGIGYALVQKFIKSSNQNDYIFALSRNIEKLKKIENLPINVIPLQCDITDTGQVDAAVSYIKNKCNSIDFLINNAGLLNNKPFKEIKSYEIDEVFNTNFKAPFYLIQKLLPLLEYAKKSHIVNISSMGGFQGSTKFAGLSAYSASKAALNCLTECLALELQTTSIKINALCIGAVETEMLKMAFPNFKPQVNACEMAEFIYHFTINNHHIMNGKVIPVALSTP
jgi:NAD(P)-dependent dehydrogenase (short-subunit alcohol dehydrogenase family)